MPLQAVVAVVGVVVAGVLVFLHATIENTASTTNDVSNEVTIFIRLIFRKAITHIEATEYHNMGKSVSVPMGICIQCPLFCYKDGIIA
jgi:hypothetical protein